MGAPERNVMKIFLSFVVLVIGGCSAGPPTAPHADEVPPAVTVDGSFRHVLHSDTIGQDFLIDVALPLSGMPDEPVPVVYVTDGNGMFQLVSITTRILQLGGELPPMIVVGIGYVVTPTAGILALRTRDLTPTIDATYEEGIRDAPVPEEVKAALLLPEGIEPGGAATFLDFIETDVKPFIAANYPAKTDDSTLVGDSFGGLFTLYALFNRTGDYQRYIAGSPSLWWDEKTLFHDEAAYADRADDLDVDLFLSVGGLEEGSDQRMDQYEQVTNARMMVRQLEDRGYPNLRLTFHLFEDETHQSVIPATMSRGLREVFANDVALPSEH